MKSNLAWPVSQESVDQPASDPLDFGAWAMKRDGFSSWFRMCYQAKGPLSGVRMGPNDTVLAPSLPHPEVTF